MIGERVVFIEDHFFNGKNYKKVREKYKLLSDIRDDKLKNGLGL
jgi:hypothetical protein